MAQTDIDTVKEFYNSAPMLEWNRLEEHPFEFLIAKHYLDRYIRPGQRVLDIGGGPGRYALYLAQKGCDVTLLDLSEGNVAFAKEQAKQKGLPLTALAGDARFTPELVTGQFDHVLLMGPLYHLLEQAGRAQAVEAATAVLRDAGNLFASFILINGGICFAMKNMPEAVLNEAEAEYIDCYIKNKSFSGNGFTKVFMTTPKEVCPFMEPFGLHTRHLVGQESILAPCEEHVLSQPEAVKDKWLEIALAVCEREDLLSFSEHLLYIGQKQ